MKVKWNIFNINDIEACGHTGPSYGMLILYGKMAEVLVDTLALVLAARMLDKGDLIVVFANYFTQVHRIFILCFSCYNGGFFNF